MVMPVVALFRALRNRARSYAVRLLLYRLLRVGWSAAALTVGALTLLGMTSAIVGGAPFDGVSRDAYRLGAFIGLRAHGNGAIYLREGWGTADDAGRWIGERAALLEIPIEKVPHGNAILAIKTQDKSLPQSEKIFFNVLVNGRTLPPADSSQSTGDGGHEYRYFISGELLAEHDETLIICLLAATNAPTYADDVELPLVRIDSLSLSAEN